MEIRVVDSCDELEPFVSALDALGHESAIAQKLPKPITSLELFSTETAKQHEQKLYLAVDNLNVVGYLKTGVKHLFYATQQGEYLEMDPLCVLDFCVSEQYRRSGIGHQLFQAMLQAEKVEPRMIAYDRPSPKLLSFLSKHAGLRTYCPQPNNFVVFNDFFDLPSHAASPVPADNRKKELS